MTEKSVVSLVGIDKTYHTGEVGVHALRKIQLEIPEGQFIVILGPSGSGKTTLLNLLGGIDRPTNGKITVAGEEIGELSDKQLTQFRRSKVGFIFQFFNLIPTLTAEENVNLALELDEKGNKLSAKEILTQVGLGDRADHFPQQLSGGEQQRVAIARALGKEAPVMLCDEPTGELDFETGIKILALLKKLNEENKQTFILVTHNAVVGKIADRVIKLRSGAVSEDILNKEILAPEKLKW